MPPLGDVAASVASLIQCSPHIDFVFTLTGPGGAFCADTREMRDILGGVSLAEPEVALWLREYLAGNIREILEKE